jgi:hypothetical protein
MAAFQIVALTHKNNRDNFFHRIGASQVLRFCVYSQNHGTDFIPDRPTAKLLLTHKVIITTVLGIGPQICLNSQNSCIDTGGGWAA